MTEASKRTEGMRTHEIFLDNGDSIFNRCEVDSEVEQDWKAGTTKYMFNDGSYVLVSGETWEVGNE